MNTGGGSMPRTADGGGAMGESGKDALLVGFDASLKLEFHGSRVNSDAGQLSVSWSPGIY